MIIKENLTINGIEFVKTYSDIGMEIEREGVRYAEAIDPARFGREYTETDTPIYTGEESEDVVDPDEATEQDYQNALTDLGVKFDA